MFGFFVLAPQTALAVATMGYLLGSIPSGLLLTKAAGLGDVRDIGSGNIGATNVLRTGNKKIAALTLLGDLLKGTVAVLFGKLFSAEAAVIAGLCAFLGHLFPVWLQFKGGKGVATYIGVLLGLFWPACLVFCATWLLVAFTSRYSSLSALTASIAAPLSLIAFDTWDLILPMAAMSLLLIIRHHANISRLLNGTETKIGAA